MREKVFSRGVTLIEIMMVVAIVSAIGGLGLMGFQGMSNRARGSDVLAQLVADQLRYVRSKAVSDSVPTALVFPSAAGTVPHSQSLYIVGGDQSGKPERVQGFSGDFPRSCIFVGLLGATGETTTPPPTSAKKGAFQVSGWYSSRDYQFIFLPSGALVTNDLPLVNGKYVIVVASGLSYSGASAPSPPAVKVNPAPGYFKLGAAADPYTITITQQGEVEVMPGVLGRTDASDPALAGWTAGPAPAFQMPTATTATEPVIKGMTILPKPDPEFLPPGVDALVRDGQYMSFTVRATDVGGGPLYCDMIAREEGGGAEVKGFACEGPQRMLWNPTTREWNSEWAWTAPPKKPEGARFEILCTVSNQKGGTKALDASAIPVIEKSNGGKFLISSSAKFTVVNDDGSGERTIPVTTSPNIYYGMAGPKISPEGDSFVYLADEESYYESGFYKSSLDGRSDTKLGLVSIGSSSGASWDLTPDGASIVWIPYSSTEIYLKKLDGSSDVPISGLSHGPPIKVRCSRTGNNNKIVYTTSSGLLVAQPWDRPNNKLLPAQYVSAPSSIFSDTSRTSIDLSPDGNRVAYGGSGGDGSSDVYIVDLASSAPPWKVPNSYYSPGSSMAAENVAWSPDGSRLATLAGNTITIVNADGTGTPRTINLTIYAGDASLTWRP